MFYIHLIFYILDLKEQIRNGVNTGKIGYTAPTKVTETEQNAVNRKNNNLDTSKGLQESWDSYDNCYMRDRNKGKNQWGVGGGVLTYKMSMYVLSYVKKKGAYGADQTEKVVAFRAERLVKFVPLELIELGKMGAFRKSGCFYS